MTILPQPITVSQPRPTNQPNLTVLHAVATDGSDVQWQCKCRSCGSAVLYWGRFLERVRVKNCRECTEVSRRQEADLWSILGIEPVEED